MNDLLTAIQEARRQLDQSKESWLAEFSINENDTCYIDAESAKVVLNWIEQLVQESMTSETT